MIKANELRIGNVCWDIHSKELVRVSALTELGMIEFTVIDRSKYPLPDGWQAGYIPLTPEWLERFGFKDANDGYRATGAEILYSIEFNNKEITLWQVCVLGKPIKWNFVQWNECEIEYVHQLQNLYFALTGEELTIQP